MASALSRLPDIVRWDEAGAAIFVTELANTVAGAVFCFRSSFWLAGEVGGDWVGENGGDLEL